MIIHRRPFGQILCWNTALPLISVGSQSKCHNFGYPYQNKRRSLASASPLISAAPYMWHLLEIVPCTNNVYTKIHIEEIYKNGALQKLFVFTQPAITCSKSTIETLK